MKNQLFILKSVHFDGIYIHKLISQSRSQPPEKLNDGSGTGVMSILGRGHSNKVTAIVHSAFLQFNLRVGLRVVFRCIEDAIHRV